MQENNEKETSSDEELLIYGHYKGVHIASFVRDIVLFGQGRVAEVCDAYGVSDTMFIEMIELPLFKKEMREIRALTEASPNALIQLRARAVVEDGLMRLQHIIQNGEKDSDRINAMKLVAQISGVLEGGRGGIDENNGKPAASGLVLNVNLGPNGLVPPKPQLRGPLREVREVIDVTPSK